MREEVGSKVPGNIQDTQTSASLVKLLGKKITNQQSELWLSTGCHKNTSSKNSKPVPWVSTDLEK